MEYDSPHPPPRRPSTWLERHPFSGRVALVLAVFALFIPVSKLLTRGEGRVSTSQFPGAALGNVTLDETTTSAPATVLVVTTEVPVTVPPAPAPIVTAAPVAAAPAVAPAAVAAPATTAKPVPTTSQPVATTAKRIVATTAKPVATTAKPVATTAKKAVATTAKPVVTTAKPTPTTTRATTPPTVAVRRYTADEVIGMIQAVWPADSVDKALEVARLESGYRNWAYNGSCCYGVFQIHYGSHKRRLAARGLGLDGLYDPKVNIAIALEIFNEQGWRPWSTS